MKTPRYALVVSAAGIAYALVLLVQLITPAALHAQTQDDMNAPLRQQVVAVAKRYQDSVVLRWVPSSAAIWRRAQTAGYRIERATLAGERPGTYAAVAAAPVMPWSQQRWAAYLDANPQLDTAQQQVIMVAGAMLEQSTDPQEMPVNDPGNIEALRAAKERFEMSYNFAMMAAERSRVAADGLGLRFVDATVQPGTAYQYRITIAGATDPYIVAPAVVDVPPAPARPQDLAKAVTVDELDTQVLLKWSTGTGHSMFNIYRAVANAPFVRLTATPIVTLRTDGGGTGNDGYLDTNLTNYTVYRYRVTGINAFAEEEELAVVSAMPRDRTPPQQPSAVRAQHTGAKDVVVTWSMNDPVENDLGGFYVLRDTSVEGEFQPMHIVPLDKRTREYRDTTASLGGTYYYSVMAFDTARNAVKSFPALVVFADSVPPAAPVLVKGTMDTNGVVRITVRHPADRDVMGYRVLIANDPEHEFTVKREVYNADSTFNREDTLVLDTVEVRTLTKAVYYKFIALDYHYNESDMSNLLVVPRPDVIPPVAPVIRDYVVTDSSIIIDFAPSSSRDVKEHAVLRRLYNAAATREPAWDTLTKAGRRDSVVNDPSGSLSATYQYAVVARDSAGLVSPLSNIITVKRVDNKVRPAVTAVAAVYDSTSKSVRLSWNYIDLPEKHRFVIYRATTASLSSYAIVADQRQRQFVDTKGAGRGTVYAVKVECDNGAESRLSERAVTR